MHNVAALLGDFIGIMIIIKILYRIFFLNIGIGIKSRVKMKEDD